MMQCYPSLFRLLLAVSATIAAVAADYCTDEGIAYNCNKKNPCVCANLHDAGTVTYHRAAAKAFYVVCDDAADPQCSRVRCNQGYIFNRYNPQHDAELVCKDRNPPYGITVEALEAEAGREFDKRCWSAEGYVYSDRLRLKKFDCRKRNPCTGGAGEGPEFGRCIPQVFFYPAGDKTPDRYIQCLGNGDCMEQTCPQEHIFNPSSQACELHRPRCDNENFSCGRTNNPCGMSLCVEGQHLYPTVSDRFYIECGEPDSNGEHSCERKACEVGVFSREINQCFVPPP